MTTEETEEKGRTKEEKAKVGGLFGMATLVPEHTMAGTDNVPIYQPPEFWEALRVCLQNPNEENFAFLTKKVRFRYSDDGAEESWKETVEALLERGLTPKEAAQFLALSMTGLLIETAADAVQAEISVQNMQSEVLNRTGAGVEEMIRDIAWTVPQELLESIDSEVVDNLYTNDGQKISAETREGLESREAVVLDAIANMQGARYIAPYVLKDIKERIADGRLNPDDPGFMGKIGSILAYVDPEQREEFLREYYEDPFSPSRGDVQVPEISEKLEGDSTFSASYLYFYPRAVDKMDPAILQENLWPEIVEDLSDEQVENVLATTKDATKATPEAAAETPKALLDALGDRKETLLDTNRSVQVVALFGGETLPEDVLGNLHLDLWTDVESGIKTVVLPEGFDLQSALSGITQETWNALGEEQKADLTKLYSHHLATGGAEIKDFPGGKPTEYKRIENPEELGRLTKKAYLITLYSGDALQAAKNRVKLLATPLKDVPAAIKTGVGVSPDEDAELARRTLLYVQQRIEAGELDLAHLTEPQRQNIGICLAWLPSGEDATEADRDLKATFEGYHRSATKEEDNPSQLWRACDQLCFNAKPTFSLNKFSENAQAAAMFNFMREWMAAQDALAVDPSNTAYQERVRQLEERRETLMKEQQEKGGGSIKMRGLSGQTVRVDAGFPFASDDLMQAGVRVKDRQVFNAMTEELTKHSELYKPDIWITDSGKIVVECTDVDENGKEISENVVITADNLENLPIAVTKFQKLAHMPGTKEDEVKRRRWAKSMLKRLDKIILEDVPVVRGRLTKTVEGEWVYESKHEKTEQEQQFEEKEREEVADFRRKHGLKPFSAHTTEALSRAREAGYWSSYGNEFYHFDERGEVVFASAVDIRTKYDCLVDFQKDILDRYPNGVPSQVCDAYYEMAVRIGYGPEAKTELIPEAVILFKDKRYYDRGDVKRYAANDPTMQYKLNKNKQDLVAARKPARKRTATTRST